MKYTIVYWSRYGNGKKIVDYLAEKIKDKKEDVEIFKTEDADPTCMPKADLYVFSAPTEAFNIQKNMKSFMKKISGLEEQKYCLINTHGMKKSIIHKMDKILSKKDMVKVADIDFQVGKNANTGEGLPEDWKSGVDNFFKKM